MAPPCVCPPPPAGPGRGWNWAQVATAVGAIAAGAGLIFTAISTYIGVLVARGQLEQSRQDSEDHARLQSSKVVMWTVLDATGDRTVVANRSTLPVTSVYGYLHRPKRDGVTGVGFPDLPPCSRFTVDHDTSDGVAVLAFTDSNGRGWTRTPDGELELGQSPETLRRVVGAKAAGGIDGPATAFFVYPAKIESIESCD